MKTFWEGKRCFVTGASGLLGSHLVQELLAQGASVTVLLRDLDPQTLLFSSGLLQKTQVVSGALEDYATLERAINEHEVDTVFHLGAQTIVGAANRSPLATFESNIRGTYHLLEACRVQKSLVKRVIVASSDKAYGSKQALPYDESMSLSGCHPYDVSKSCADLLSKTYAHSYHLPVLIARCGNIFGGGDLNWSRIIPGTIRQFLEDKPIVIRSDGQFTRDYVYVADAVNAYLLLAEKLIDKDLKGEAFNFGPAKPYTVLEVVRALQKEMKKEHLLPIVLDEVKNEIRDQYLCSEKARTVLNWRPRYSLEEGLRETIAWYEQYLRLACEVS